MEGNTKDKIIQASIDLFATKGYTESSIKEIAECTGIKSGTIYFYFKSKKEILEQILEIYESHTRSVMPSQEELEAQIYREDPRTILNNMFFIFENPRTDVYLKISKIILHEQFRDEHLSQFVKEFLIVKVERYLAFTIQKLVELGKIPPADHRHYAKLINSLNIYALMVNGHRAWDSFGEGEFYSRDKALSRIVEHLIQGADVLPEPEGV